MMNTMATQPYSLKFSHNIIEHLGLKLYQNKPTNVIAELVSNAWDAMADKVWIDLVSDGSGAPQYIAIADNGVGMSEEVLINNYLVIGKVKDVMRVNPKRPPMGRKGIGKLAPFGVAKKIELITIHEGKVNWLKLNYQKMIGADTNDDQFIEYHPDEVYRNVQVDDVDVSTDSTDIDSLINKFLNNVKEKGSGTFILCSDLTIRRPITPDQLKESLGRRFTVTLNRPDFNVFINGLELQEEHCFPAWELRTPLSGFEEEEILTSLGSKKIKFWVGFVDKADWPQEEAGVGVYAHGKIAQDRPFFFGVKGSEIFTRYMYGVVEADWIDELEDDAISTDRTSIDWTNPLFDEFKKWGETKVRSWIKLYQKARQDKAHAENTEVVDKVVADKEISITSSEKKHLVDLLSDITPKLSKDPEQTDKLVDATLKAWTHEPARRLIKKLWEQTSHFESNQFPDLIYKLVEELVPESLSLAVVFSQRVYALTQLEQRIMTGNETQLQQLIEQFPWILGSEYEKYFARKSLIKIVQEAHNDSAVWSFRGAPVSTPNDYKIPDFVFLSDTSEQSIVVVELKGPAATASWLEYNQLQSYMQYLQSRFPDANVTGFLIARNFDPAVEKQISTTTTLITWESILLSSRKKHMQLLAALLAGTEADANDSRVVQICELGGKPVQDFIQLMSNTSPELKTIANKLSRS